MASRKPGLKPNMTNQNEHDRGITSDTTQNLPAVVNTTQKQREGQLGGITGKGFMPGKSGNPNGRPKGVRNMNTIVTEALQKLGAKDVEGNPVPIDDALVQKIITMALDGDRKMIEMIWNYRDGKPPQNIDLTSKGERVGTVVITAEEERRIEELFAPRMMLPETNEYANNKLQSNKSDGSNHTGGHALPEAKQSGSAYEVNP